MRAWYVEMSSVEETVGAGEGTGGNVMVDRCCCGFLLSRQSSGWGQGGVVLGAGRGLVAASLRARGRGRVGGSGLA